MISMLKLSGLHCDSCKALIEDVAKDVSGIVSCTVSLEVGRARVEHDSTESLDALVREIAALGEYRAEVV